MSLLWPKHNSLLITYTIHCHRPLLQLPIVSSSFADRKEPFTCPVLLGILLSFGSVTLHSPENSYLKTFKNSEQKRLLIISLAGIKGGRGNKYVYGDRVELKINIAGAFLDLVWGRSLFLAVAPLIFLNRRVDAEKESSVNFI